MIAHGFDDDTVMAISGHSSTRMLGRYTHPTEERKIGAPALPPLSTKRAHDDAEASSTPDEIAEILREIVVDGRRLELPTSALRTRRSPN